MSCLVNGMVTGKSNQLPRYQQDRFLFIRIKVTHIPLSLVSIGVAGEANIAIPQHETGFTYITECRHTHMYRCQARQPPTLQPNVVPTICCMLAYTPVYIYKKLCIPICEILKLLTDLSIAVCFSLSMLTCFWRKYLLWVTDSNTLTLCLCGELIFIKMLCG